MHATSDTDQFIFKADSVKFGDLELTDKTVEISLGLAGVGLPEKDYIAVARVLYSEADSIICPSSHGSFCYSETLCADLFTSIEDLMITMRLVAPSENEFQMPLAALLR